MKILIVSLQVRKPGVQGQTKNGIHRVIIPVFECILRLSEIGSSCTSLTFDCGMLVFFTRGVASSYALALTNDDRYEYSVDTYNELRIGSISHHGGCAALAGN